MGFACAQYNNCFICANCKFHLIQWIQRLIYSLMLKQNSSLLQDTLFTAMFTKIMPEIVLPNFYRQMESTQYHAGCSAYSLELLSGCQGIWEGPGCSWSLYKCCRGANAALHDCPVSLPSHLFPCTDVHWDSRLKSATRMRRIINIEIVSQIIYTLLSHQYLAKRPQQQMLQVMTLNVF